MSIIPGTTPTLRIALDGSIKGCKTAELCIQCDRVQIVKTLADLTLSADGKEVTVTLSQKETLQLPDNKVALVQLRVLIGESALATNVMSVSTKELLHREELTAYGSG